jgi:hypothetical protein
VDYFEKTEQLESNIYIAKSSAIKTTKATTILCCIHKRKSQKKKDYGMIDTLLQAEFSQVTLKSPICLLV